MSEILVNIAENFGKLLQKSKLGAIIKMYKYLYKLMKDDLTDATMEIDYAYHAKDEGEEENFIVCLVIVILVIVLAGLFLRRYNSLAPTREDPCGIVYGNFSKLSPVCAGLKVLLSPV